MSENKKNNFGPVSFVTSVFAIAGMAIAGFAGYCLCPFLFELIKPVCIDPPKHPVPSLSGAFDDIPFYVFFIISLIVAGAYLGGSAGFAFSKINSSEFTAIYSNFWPRLGYVLLFSFLISFMNSFVITFLIFKAGFFIAPFIWPFLFAALGASLSIPVVIINIARKKYI